MSNNLNESARLQRPKASNSRVEKVPEIIAMDVNNRTGS